jgi:hypothetical protein
LTDDLTPSLPKGYFFRVTEGSVTYDWHTYHENAKVQIRKKHPLGFGSSLVFQGEIEDTSQKDPTRAQVLQKMVSLKALWEKRLEEARVYISPYGDYPPKKLVK